MRPRHCYECLLPASVRIARQGRRVGAPRDPAGGRASHAASGQSFEAA